MYLNKYKIEIIYFQKIFLMRNVVRIFQVIDYDVKFEIIGIQILKIVG